MDSSPQQWSANPAGRVILVIALLSSAAGAAILGLVHAFGPPTHATELINLTGRQRMLSQEIAKHALRLQKDPGAAAALNASIEDFSRLRTVLEAERFGTFVDDLGLTEQNLATRTQVQAYLATARAIPATADPGAAVERLLEQERRLLPSLEALTNAVEAGTARVLERQSLQLAASIIAVGILSVLAGYGLLAPVLRLISSKEQENLILAEQKRKVLEAIDNCPDGILITDDFLRIEYVNPAFSGLMGYSSSELKGKTPRVLQSGKHSGSFYREMWERLSVEGHWKGDLIDLTKGGDLITLHSTIARVRRGDAPAGFISIHRDVSIHRRLEAEAESARDSAVQALKTRNEFFTMISHDFRAPLYSIISAAALLKSDTVHREESATAIQIAAGTLLDLVNNLLDYARMESGRLTLNLQPFPLARPIREVALILKPQAERKNLTLAAHTGDDLPATVIGDEQRLRRILLNLAGNAVKFTEKGRIDLRAQRSGDSIEFSVQDTGPGIPETLRQKMFDPFAQGEAARDGSGLGLAICRELTALMGGTLEVETGNAGSRFYFTVALPAVVDVQSEDSHRPLNILIVDDNPVSASVSRQSLAAAGHNARIAETAAAGIEQAKASRFDVVLMDYQLPDMNGFEAASILRQLDGSVQPSVILGFTAAAEELSIELALRAGMDGVISRGTPRDEIIQLIRSLAARTR